MSIADDATTATYTIAYVDELHAEIVRLRAARDGGGPAFPRTNERDSLGNSIAPGAPGMSLRDWFAGQTLAGMMADPAVNPDPKSERTRCAKFAYQMADAMIAERAKEPT